MDNAEILLAINKGAGWGQEVRRRMVVGRAVMETG